MKDIYSQKEFMGRLEAERSLADRGNHEFSIIIFNLKKAMHHKDFFSSLGRAFKKSLRKTDEVGWFDENHIGVILPETSAAGATRPADDVCSQVFPNKQKPAYSVFTYPVNWFKDELTADQQSNREAMLSPCRTPKQVGSVGLTKKIQQLTHNGIPLWKKIMDMVCALAGLILISPLLFLIALYIKLVSPGPIFFKQERVGYMGQRFTCLKFRTMFVDAQPTVHQQHLHELVKKDRPLAKLDDCDLRIIPLGRFMRKTGIDELPQLINVIRGEMSLVGPRPCIPYEAKQFLTWQCKRFETLPGLTGLWQVNGKNRTTFNEMMRYDVSYVKKRSAWLDFQILFKTPAAIIAQFTDESPKIKDIEFIS